MTNRIIFIWTILNAALSAFVFAGLAAKSWEANSVTDSSDGSEMSEFEPEMSVYGEGEDGGDQDQDEEDDDEGVESEMYARYKAGVTFRYYRPGCRDY
jgi:hypothetical protein